jgi:hypothetical protein
MHNQLLRIIAMSALIVAGEFQLIPVRVHASPLLDMTGDTSGTGGFQARTVPGGATAAYFNPALLLEVPAGMTVGFMVLSQGITISLDGRPGTQFAVPDNISTAEHANGDRFENYPIGTNLLQFGRMKSGAKAAFVARPRQDGGSGHETLTYETIALVVKAFHEHFALGFNVLVPNGQFTRMRAFFNDEREQYFSNSLHPELFSDRMSSLSLGVGAGLKISEEFSIGAGATIGLKTNVAAATYVADTGDLGKILIDMDAPVNVGVAPYFGATFKSTERLRFSASLHTPQRVELGSQFKFLLSNGVEQSSGITLVLDYMPWQVSVGASYDLLRDATRTLSVSASVLYARWSDYLDRHGFEPTPAYAWSDTLSPTIGVRYRFAQLSTFADFAYTPTPVPPQTGRTNYVDSDRLSTSLGGEFGFGLWGTNFKLGAQFQLHRLLPRYQSKLRTPTQPDGKVVAPERVRDEVPDDAQVSGEPLAGAEGLQTNNPGWPGFASMGWLVGGTVYLSLAF